MEAKYLSIILYLFPKYQKHTFWNIPPVLLKKCTPRIVKTLVKSVFDLQFDKRKSQINLKWTNATAHYQNILHGDTLYDMNNKKYITGYAELQFGKVSFDRMVMIFYGISNVCLICFTVGLLPYSKRVHDQRYELPLFIYASVLF